MLPELSTRARLADWQATDTARQRAADWVLFLTKFSLLVCGAVVFFLLGMAVGKLTPKPLPADPDATELVGVKHGLGLAEWH